MLLLKVLIFHFRVENFDKSLDHLIKAIDCNKKIREDELNLSSTHLNVCAMYSKKGDHSLAYQHAKTALWMLPIAYWRLKESVDDPDELSNDKA